MRRRFDYFQLVLLLVAVCFLGVASASAERPRGQQNDIVRRLNKIIGCHANISSCRLSYSNCGRAPLNALSSGTYQSTIMNGSPEEYGDYPSFVRIRSNWDYSTTSCGGVLISDRLVLTAAHCLRKKNNDIIPPRAMEVIVGEHRLSVSDGHEQTGQVQSYCESRRYVPTATSPRYDFAVLMLQSPVQFNNHVQPACLPQKNMNLGGRNSLCYLAGFGVMGWDMDHAILPDVLQKMRMRRIPCNFWHIRELDKSRSCWTKYDGQGDSCSGDSGSAILCLVNGRWTIAALVSYGSKRCNEDGRWIGVYTRITHLLGDIRRDCRIQM